MRHKNFEFRLACKSIPSTTYLTHGIHPYTAKFIPQIPRFFIEKYSKEGDTILDPFMGSGTTLLESKITGRNSFGADINPLAKLISKVKTTSINHKKLEKGIYELNRFLNRKIKSTYDAEFYNKEYWFHKKSIEELKKIMSVIDKLFKEGKIDNHQRDFFRVCFSSIIRASSYADPKNPKTYCSPVMRIKKERGIRTYPIKYFKEAIESNAKHIKDFSYIAKKNEAFAKVLNSSSATSINLPSKKVDLIITSPPYANAQDYFRNIKLELFWLKEADKQGLLELEKQQIGGENHAALYYKERQNIGIREIDRVINRLYRINKKSAYIVYRYFDEMEKNIKECFRVLKKGGHYILVVGNNWVRGKEVPIHIGLIKIAQRNGFKLSELGYDLIKSRKFMIKRNNDAPIIEKDWVIDLIKA
jgi:DNA modification methylase